MEIFIQVFINYHFSYTRFCACQTVLGAPTCTWEIMPVNKQTYTLFIIAWYSSRKCSIKLVLKPLAAKKGLFISVLCIAPFLYIILPSITVHYAIYLHSSTSNFDKLKWEQSSESNILPIEHELVLENSSSAAVNTLLNTIIYLKAAKYLNIRLRHLLN